MKKGILIICAISVIFGLMAFSYISSNATDSNQLEVKKELASRNETVVFVNDFLEHSFPKRNLNLVYDISPRFNHTITIDQLRSAVNVKDLIPKTATRWNDELFSVIVATLLNNERDKSEYGKGNLLNTSQIKLLKSVQYSTNIFVSASLNDAIQEFDDSNEEQLIYYMTVVPEKQAEYKNGKNALLQYLRKESRKETAIMVKEKLQPCRISFTVTTKGTVKEVKLNSTSGYSSVDESLVELIKNMPNKWNSAQDSNGNPVDQELVFFFGRQGC